MTSLIALLLLAGELSRTPEGVVKGLWRMWRNGRK
jgi:hypothetical protein